MYTTMDLSEIQYKKGIRKSEYKFIEDIEQFTEDIALGVLEEDVVLLSKEQKSYITQIKEVISEDNIKFIEEMPDVYISSEDEEEKTFSDSKEVLPKKVKINNSSAISTDSTKEVQEKKASIFSRLFGFGRRRKRSESETVDLGISSFTDSLKVDYSRGKNFKRYLVENNYLTEEQIKCVEDRIEEEHKLGNKKRFLEVCREEKMFIQDDINNSTGPEDIKRAYNKNEDICAELLAFTTSKEVLSKYVILTNLDKIRTLNEEIKGRVNFFIFDKDERDRKLVVCKDLSVHPKFYLLERYFPGYTIEVVNTVEGVTKEILSLIRG